MKFLKILYFVLIMIVGLFLVGCNQNTPIDEEPLNAEDIDMVVDSKVIVDDNFYEDHPKAEMFNVPITGEELITKSFEEVALLWNIDPELYLDNIKSKYNLKNEYKITDTINTISEETYFRPRQLKELADDLAN